MKRHATGVRSDRRSVADAMLDVNTVDLRDRLPALGRPLLGVGTWYRMRTFTTRAAVDSTFRAQYAGAPHWSFALADSARHFVMLDAPVWTWDRVDAFLAAETPAACEGGARR